MSSEWIIQIASQNWKSFLTGAEMTLYISLIGTVIGSIIGMLIGVVRTIPKGDKGAKKVFLTIINAILNAYVEFFRGTPMIVQAMVIYYGSDLAFGIDMDRTFAAIFIVSINTGAYMAEIVRGGIISIDKGQFEAAQAIGMNHIQTMINVVLPQVIRNILPATGTSVLNVIGVTELYFTTKSIAGNNFRYFESFFITCIVYFIMTFTITRILRFVEKKLDGPENYNMTGNQMQVQKPEDALNKA